jgi:hypothetical protein
MAIPDSKKEYIKFPIPSFFRSNFPSSSHLVALLYPFPLQSPPLRPFLSLPSKEFLLEGISLCLCRDFFIDISKGRF